MASAPASYLTRSTHHLSLASIKPQKSYPGGFRIDVHVDDLPVLKGMALSLLTLEPLGVREPHWHPNANELSYVLSGTGLMTLFTPGAGHDTFTLKAGETVIVPKGYLHHIENTGDTPLQMALCFDHEAPEDLDLSLSVSVMPHHILAGTFGSNTAFFDRLKKHTHSVFISQKSQATKPTRPFITSPHKFDLDAEQAKITNKGGWVKITNRALLPTLDGLALYTVLLHPKGAREPHWHPNANELNYLVSGSARITLLSPNGSIDTFDMKPGDMSFLPQGHLHYIENTSNEDAFFAIFFNNTSPNDIGLSGGIGAYPDDLLAPLFDVTPDYFSKLPKPEQDILVITS